MNTNIEPLSKKFKQGESEQPTDHLDLKVNLGPVINEKKLAAAAANSQFLFSGYPNAAVLSTTQSDNSQYHN